jgi:acyl dehydratase
MTMGLDAARLLAFPFEDVVQRYTERDTMLYALGLGLGADPLDGHDLRYVYEHDLIALPSMAVVLGHPGDWGAAPGLGIDGPRVLHAGMEVELSRPLAPAATVRAREQVTALVDKGRDKGALMLIERRIVDESDGQLLATLRSLAMLRGNGGGGENVGTLSTQHKVPERAPDHVVSIPTLARQALIYRLSGDYNPLHAEPAVARSVGFERPILHGLCTFGIAVAALVRHWCGGDARLLRRLALRWTAPVMPGDTLRIESWRDGAVLSYRVFVAERDEKVVDGGRAEFF